MKLAVLIAAGVLCVSPSDAQDQLQEKLDRIYGRGGYQRELRLEQPIELPSRDQLEDEDQARSGEGPGRSSRRRNPAKPVQVGGSEMAVWLPWTALALFLTLALYIFFRSRRSSPTRAPVQNAGIRAPPSAEAPADAVPDPALLAREGRFAEAIHALLLTAIDRVRVSSGRPLGPSLTSREVTSMADIGPASRAALDRLVRAVEVTLFGGRPAREAEYLACAATLESIAGAE